MPIPISTGSSTAISRELAHALTKIAPGGVAAIATSSLVIRIELVDPTYNYQSFVENAEGRII
jgi:hypothetical protein